MAADKRTHTKRLGRGLNALIETPVRVEAEGKQVDQSIPVLSDSIDTGLTQVQVVRITPSPYQPRTSFDETELEQLAQSIRQAGVIQPIVVRERHDEPGSFELIAGERRWRAARLAGLESIPAVIVQLEDRDAAQWALIENLQRKDLNPMERAHALRGLCDRFQIGQRDLAQRIGLDRSTVANLIRVTELEEPIQTMIAAGELSIGHGKVLLSIEDSKIRLRLARQAAAEHWSVRKLEQQRKPTVLSEGASNARVSSPTLADLERRLSEHLGTRVRITTTRDGTRGRVSMEFYSLDHFDGLLARIGYSEAES